ncbi:endoplasmic reticulum-Golgi intermediate compartment protein 2 [Anopheles ziemanni]|uniref:endoplasmic reticulum-Golgi intermediate compartment protein 2 n=1 Tax=Anopheles ziemanni TaxID=345580 RepID=UPI002658BEE6|nr:endoplasmic reticulum-Golgi intermediate compartment protein 2 isoform X2 [Anopheles coustani]XP_058178863.1 endoplasmic reticulum-Golgi intermediate compartment protein 2 [Anopheles ziemanni]
MLRYRGVKQALDAVSQLDAFPKVKEEFVQPTRVGGTLSLISRLVIIFLIYNEVSYYLDSRLIFKFVPDTDLQSKLKVHIDLTVAMPCKSIGADILDSTSQNVFSFGILQEEDTWFELCPSQRIHFDFMQHHNSYLRNEYHSVAEILYKSDHAVVYSMPERVYIPERPHDACRIHGVLTLNKVAGNFHITVGKTVHFSRGHIHLNSIFANTPTNFSHRINRFSFGEHTAGIIHPLEGDEKIYNNGQVMMQYFIEVVPTDVEKFYSHSKTYQYTVRENLQHIDIDKGMQAVAGIYFKYDMSALRVIVRQDRDGIAQFIVRLSSIIAGIVVISGFLSKCMHLIGDLCCPRSHDRLPTETATPKPCKEQNLTKGAIVIS